MASRVVEMVAFSLTRSDLQLLSTTDSEPDPRSLSLLALFHLSLTRRLSFGAYKFFTTVSFSMHTTTRPSTGATIHLVLRLRTSPHYDDERMTYRRSKRRSSRRQCRSIDCSMERLLHLGLRTATSLSPRSRGCVWEKSLPVRKSLRRRGLSQRQRLGSTSIPVRTRFPRLQHRSRGRRRSLSLYCNCRSMPLNSSMLSSSRRPPSYAGVRPACSSPSLAETLTGAVMGLNRLQIVAQRLHDRSSCGDLSFNDPAELHVSVTTLIISKTWWSATSTGRTLLRQRMAPHVSAAQSALAMGE